ncbi:MAG: four helix bundle protein [Acidobacteria bacterium]|nr:four helix bundle protein [Acidobacteriota bacterium]
MTKRRIEDLVAWQISRTLAAEVYQLTSTADFERDQHLRIRLRATAGRIMTSIAAGYEQKTCRAFADYLARAETATAELRSLLYLAGDAALVEHGQAERLVDRTCATRRSRGSASRSGSIDATPLRLLDGHSRQRPDGVSFEDQRRIAPDLEAASAAERRRHPEVVSGRQAVGLARRRTRRPVSCAGRAPAGPYAPR